MASKRRSFISLIFIVNYHYYIIIIKCYRLSQNVVTCDVDCNVSTAYC